MITDEQLVQWEQLANELSDHWTSYNEPMIVISERQSITTAKAIDAVPLLIAEVRRLRAELSDANDIIKSWSGR